MNTPRFSQLLKALYSQVTQLSWWALLLFVLLHYVYRPAGDAACEVKPIIFISLIMSLSSASRARARSAWWKKSPTMWA